MSDQKSILFDLIKLSYAIDLYIYSATELQQPISVINQYFLIFNFL